MYAACFADGTYYTCHGLQTHFLEHEIRKNTRNPNENYKKLQNETKHLAKSSQQDSNEPNNADAKSTSQQNDRIWNWR